MESYNVRGLIAASVAAVLLGSGTPASAATFATALVPTEPTDYAQCSVTVVRGTATLSVELRDYFGLLVAPTFDDCNTGTLTQYRSCSVTAPAGADVFCLVNSSTSRIRSVIGVWDSTNAVRAMLPATRK